MRIRAIQTEVRDGELSPVRAAFLVAKLSALYANVLDEVRAADHAYNEVLVEALKTDEAASRARVKASVTPQYQRLREAKDTEKFAIEIVRSLKKYLTLQQEEMRSK